MLGGMFYVCIFMFAFNPSLSLLCIFPLVVHHQDINSAWVCDYDFPPVSNTQIWAVRGCQGDADTSSPELEPRAQRPALQPCPPPRIRTGG